MSRPRRETCRAAKRARNRTTRFRATMIATLFSKYNATFPPVMEINDFPYASALRMCTTLRGQDINFAICSLLRCQMYMKSLSRDRVQKFFDLAKIIFKSQCKSLQFASNRRRIFLEETCRKTDFAHFVRRAEKVE